MNPPFCPNPKCSHHHSIEEAFRPYWQHYGYHNTKVVGKVKRFKCKACKKSFSERSFSIHYYTKKNLDLKEIHRAISQSESLSSIARKLRCSEDSIQNRIDRLGRSSIAVHSRLTSQMSLSEHITADGFESFDRSQYFPNQINLVLGKTSQFLYGYSHTTIRRKGRMTKKQKKTRAELEKAFKPNKNATIVAFKEALKVLCKVWKPEEVTEVELWTDEHKAYPIALMTVPKLRAALAKGELIHKTHSSKAPRTLHNPLFSANYYDRELRKDLAAFRRESTCFTRNVCNGLMRFNLHLIYHNYYKHYRIKQPLMTFVHAEAAGLPPFIIEDELKGYYEDRRFLSKLNLSEEETRIWLKKARTPLKDKDDYVPKYAKAA
ncbi:hypothetical protein MASR2M29_06600 [Spirochaetota bacterium]